MSLSYHISKKALHFSYVMLICKKKSFGVWYALLFFVHNIHESFAKHLKGFVSMDNNIYSVLSQQAAKTNYSYGLPRYNNSTDPDTNSQFLKFRPDEPSSVEIVPFGAVCDDDYEPDLSSFEERSL